MIPVPLLYYEWMCRLLGDRLAQALYFPTGVTSASARRSASAKSENPKP